MFRVILLFLVACVVTNVNAEIAAPFSTSNLSPFNQVHGLPASRGAGLLPNKAMLWEVQTQVANSFTESAKGSESILIDGESYKVNFILRYGLGDRWEVGVDVPFIRHEAGQLDPFIEGFHEIFGFSQANRENRARNRLEYSYKSIENRLQLDKAESGLGDVRFNLGYTVYQNNNRDWSVRGGVKVPTGNSKKFTGSDAVDVFAGLYFSDEIFLGIESLSFHCSIGTIALGEGKVIGSETKNLVAFGSSTLAWKLSPRFSLKAQFDFHSAFYDSEVKELGDFSGQLVLGGSLILGRKLQLDLSVSEDVIVDTAPDVVFGFGLRSIL